MDKKEVSKMLGYIKHHARPGNQNGEGTRDASECLNVYTQLKNIDKPAFLAKFANNKGSLKWVDSYSIKNQAEFSTAASSTENWFTKCSQHVYMHVCSCHPNPQP